MENAGLTIGDVAEAIEIAVESNRVKNYRDRASGQVREGYMDDEREVFVSLDPATGNITNVILPRHQDGSPYPQYFDNLQSP
jgi:hypothetical protein